MKSVTIKIYNTVTKAHEEVEVTKDGKLTTIKAQKGVNYEFFDHSIGRAPNHIITRRKGKDLLISFEREGQADDLLIEDFYEIENSEHALIGIAEDGEYYYYIPDTGEVADYVTQLQSGDAEGHALGGERLATPLWVALPTGFPWWLGLGVIPFLFDKDKKPTPPAPEPAKLVDNTKLGEIGKPVTVDAIANDTLDPIDPTTIQLIDPVTGAKGDTVVVAGQGTWTLEKNAAGQPTGKVTFTPAQGFTASPDAINYTAKTTDGREATPAKITISYLVTVPNTQAGDIGEVVTQLVPKDDSQGFDNSTVKLIDPITGRETDIVVVAGQGTWTVVKDASGKATGEIAFTPEPGFTANPTPLTYAIYAKDPETGELIRSQDTAVAVTYPSLTTADREKGQLGKPVTQNVTENDDQGVDPTTVMLVNPVTHELTYEVVVPNEGTWTVNPGTDEVTFTPSPNFDSSPTPIDYVVKKDKDGDYLNPTPVSVVYTPVLSPDSKLGEPGKPVTQSVVGNDSSDTDPATIQLIDPVTGTSGDTVAVPGQGTWTVDKQGNVTFTPEAGFTGDPDPIKYKANDKNGNPIPETTVDVVVAISAPLLVPDFKLGEAGKPVTQDIAGNDDTDLDPATIQLIDPKNPSVLSDTLVIAGEGTWTLDKDPATGKPNGSVTFTPEVGFMDSPSTINYTGKDKNGKDIKPTTVDIIVPPQATTPTSPDSKLGEPGKPVTQDVTGNDGSNIDPTTIQLIDPKNPNNPPSDEVVVPGQGTWTVEKDPTTGKPTGEVTFTPETGFTGDPDPIKYTGKDNNGKDVPPTSVDVVVPTSPDETPTSPDSKVGEPGKPVTQDVTGNDGSNIDPTTIQLIDPKNPNNPPSDEVVVPGQGTWTVEKDPTTGKPTGEVTFTPETGFTGDPDPIKYTGKDNNGKDVPPTSVDVVVPEEPTPTVPDVKLGEPGKPVTQDVTGNDGSNIDPTTIQLIDPKNPNNPPSDEVVVPGQGTWTVEKDPTTGKPTGEVTFTPEPEFKGDPDPIKYTGKDNNGKDVPPTSVDVIVPKDPTPAYPDTAIGQPGETVKQKVTDNDGSNIDPTTIQLIDPKNPNNPPSDKVVVPGQGTWTVEKDPTTGKPTGEVTFTPEPEFKGDPDPIEYTGKDNNGNDVPPTSVDVVVDLTPAVSLPDTKPGVQGQPVTQKVTGNDGNVKPETVKLIDPVTGEKVDTVVVPNEGTWTVKPGTDEVTFTPNPDFKDSPKPINYVVEDNLSNTELPPTPVNVVYPAPAPAPATVAISAVKPASVEGKTPTDTLEFKLTFTDPDNQVNAADVLVRADEGSIVSKEDVLSITVDGQAVNIDDFFGKGVMVTGVTTAKEPAIVMIVKDDNLPENTELVSLTIATGTSRVLVTEPKATGTISDEAIAPPRNPNDPENPSTPVPPTNDNPKVPKHPNQPHDPENPSENPLVDPTPNNTDGDKPMVSLTGLTEVNEAVGTVTYTISLDRPATEDIVVTYVVRHKDGAVSNNPTENDDFTQTIGQPQTVTIKAGDTKATVTVGINDDVPFEGPEDYSVSITHADNKAIINDKANQVITTIKDDGTGTPDGRDPNDPTNYPDPKNPTGEMTPPPSPVNPPDNDKPGVTLTGLDKVNEAVGTVEYTVHLANPDNTKDTVVEVTLTNGKAQEGTDYTGTTYTVTIPAGETTGSFSVPVVNDNPAVFEGPEDYKVEITKVNGEANTPNPASQTVTTTIYDDGTGTTDGRDPKNPDNLTDPNDPTSPMKDPTTPPPAADNDKPGVTLTGLDKVNEAVGTVEYTVHLANPDNTKDTVVEVTLTNGKAQEGTDYTGTTYTVTIPAGETTGSFSVPVVNDNPAVFEGPEDYKVEITKVNGEANTPNPASQTVTTTIYDDGTGTTDGRDPKNPDNLTDPNDPTSPMKDPTTPPPAADNDKPGVTLTGLDKVNEAVGTVEYTVHLANPDNTKDTVVEVTLTNGKAQEGTDYTGTTYTVTIPAGETTGSFSVPVVNDNPAVFEGPEDYKVEITKVNGEANTPNPASQTVTTTIYDDGTGTTDGRDPKNPDNLTDPNDPTSPMKDPVTPPPAADNDKPGVTLTGLDKVNEAVGTVEYTVHLANPDNTKDTVVEVTLTNGKAQEGTDYTGTTYTVTIPAGETTGSFSVPVVNDNPAVFEGPEDYKVEITKVNGEANTPNPASQTVTTTIYDDGTGTTDGRDPKNPDNLTDPNDPTSPMKDPTTPPPAADNDKPGVTLTGLDKVNEAVGTVEYTVHLANPDNTKDTVVEVTLTNGKAQEGTDYTGTTYTVTIPAGETTGSFSVPVVNDNPAVFEGPEDYKVEITKVNGEANTPNPASQTVTTTIYDDGTGTTDGRDPKNPDNLTDPNDPTSPMKDPTTPPPAADNDKPGVTLTGLDKVNEAVGTVEYTVHLANPDNTKDTVVEVTLTNGKAQEGTDYTGTTYTVTIPAGETTGSFSVPVVNDNPAVFEGPEDYKVEITKVNGEANTPNPASQTVTTTIYDDGTGTTDGRDPKNPDNLTDPNDPTSPMKDPTTPPPAADNDKPGVTLTGLDKVNEAVGTVEYTVHLANPDNTKDTVVEVTLTNGKAQEGTDYTGTTYTVTIPAGETTGSFSVPVVNDNPAVFEGPEDYKVEITKVNGEANTPNPASQTVTTTIYDDGTGTTDGRDPKNPDNLTDPNDPTSPMKDPTTPPPAADNDKPGVTLTGLDKVNEAVGTVEYTVHLANPDNTKDTVVEVTLTNGKAQEGTDYTGTTYTVTIPAGETTGSFSVPVVNDNPAVFEGPEDYKVEITKVNGEANTPNPASQTVTTTIYDDGTGTTDGRDPKNPDNLTDPNDPTSPMKDPTTPPPAADNDKPGVTLTGLDKVNEAVGTVEYTVHLANPDNTKDTVVEVTLTNGKAQEGTDYTGTTYTVTIPAGETTGSFSVPVVNDNPAVFEGPEDYKVEITKVNGEANTPNPASQTVTTTIYDDGTGTTDGRDPKNPDNLTDPNDPTSPMKDPTTPPPAADNDKPGVTLTGLDKVNEAVGTVEYTVHLANPDNTKDTVVEVTLTNGKAQEGTDYTGTTYTVTIPAGETTGSFSVPVVNDNPAVFEGPEDYKVEITKVNGEANTPNPASQTVTTTIYDDGTGTTDGRDPKNPDNLTDPNDPTSPMKDPTTPPPAADNDKPGVTLTGLDKVNEAVGTVEYTVHLANPDNTKDTVVEVTLTNGKAQEGTDYTGTTYTVTIPAGETTGSFSVPVVNDNPAVFEGPEDYKVEITKVNGEANTPNPASQTVTTTIYDDGTGTTDGRDPKNPDNLTDPNDPTSPMKDPTTPPPAADNDKPGVTLTGLDKVNEAVGTVEYTVHLANPDNTKDTVVEVTLTNGKAQEGTDYTGTTYTVTIPAGETTGSFSVPVVNDNPAVFEGPEDYKVEITKVNGEANTPNPASQTVTTTIYDDGTGTTDGRDPKNPDNLTDPNDPTSPMKDPTTPPPAADNDKPGVTLTGLDKVNEAVGTVEYTVHLANPDNTKDTVVEVTLTNGKAQEGTDYTGTTYTVTIPAGETTGSFSVPVVNDNPAVFEGPEDYKVEITKVNGEANTPNPASQTVTTTIYDDGTGTTDGRDPKNPDNLTDPNDPTSPMKDPTTPPPAADNDKPGVTLTGLDKVNEAVGTVEYTVHLANPDNTKDTVVEVTLTNGKAQEGTDYTGTTYTVTIPAGETTGSFSVPVVNDNPAVFEGPEDYKVEITKVNGEANTPNPASQTVTTTIYDDGTGTTDGRDPKNPDNLTDPNDPTSPMKDPTTPPPAADNDKPGVTLTGLDKVNEAVGTVEYTVHLANPDNTKDTVVEVTLTNGKAQEGTDYTGTTYTVTIPAGETTGSFSVPVVNDNPAVFEGPEDYKVEITKVNGEANTPNPASQTVTTTIYDDGTGTTDGRDPKNPDNLTDPNDPTSPMKDPTTPPPAADNDKPGVTLTGLDKVNEAVGTVEYTVHLANPDNTKDTVVEVTLTNGKAQEGTDYTGTTYTVTIPAGETTGSFSVPVVNDNPAVFEGPEDYKVEITKVNGEANTPNPASQTVTTTIYDDGTGTTDGRDPKNPDNLTDPNDPTSPMKDPTTPPPAADNDKPGVTLTGLDKVNEAVGTVEYTVHLANPDNTKDTVVEVTLTNGKAQEGTDYTGTTYTVTIPAGETTGSFSVPVVNDNPAVFEGPEDYKVEITKVNGEANTPNPASQTVTTTIYDDGTGTTDGRDPKNPDNLTDPNDPTSPMKDPTTPPPAADNDKPGVTLTGLDKVNEAVGTVEYTVHLANPDNTKDTVVEVTLTNGKAQEGTDYTGTTYTVTIPAGETTGSFSVPVVNDNPAVFEGPEDYKVEITKVNGEANTPNPASQTVTTTIYDDGTGTTDGRDPKNPDNLTDPNDPTSPMKDPTTPPPAADNDKPLVSIAKSEEVAEVDGYTFNHTITLNNASTEPTVVKFKVEGGNTAGKATLGTDFAIDNTATITIDADGNGTATFAPGVTEVKLPIKIIGDDNYEGKETFTVTLSTPETGANYSLDPATDKQSVTDGIFDDGSKQNPPDPTNPSLPPSDDDRKGATLDITATTATANETAPDNVLEFTVSLTDPDKKVGTAPATITVDQASTLTAEDVASVTVNGVNVPVEEFFTKGYTIDNLKEGDAPKVVITAKDDETFEKPENLVLAVSTTNTNVTVGKEKDTGTVNDNDTPVVSITGTPSTNENGKTSDGKTVPTYTIAIENGKETTDKVVVKFKLDTKDTDGTLTANAADLGAVKVGGQTLTPDSNGVYTAEIPAGETSVDVTVDIVNDSVYEGKETYKVVLTEAKAGDTDVKTTVAEKQVVSTDIHDDGTTDGTTTITDENGNDKPTLSISSPSVAEGVDAKLEFTLTLDKLSAKPVDLSLALADITAEAGKDYNATYEIFENGEWKPLAGNTVTIPAGTQSIQVRIPVVDDPLPENTETLKLTATEQASTDVLKTKSAEGVGTITDNDVPKVSIAANVTVAEVADTQITHKVTLNEAPVTPITVNFAIEGTSPTGLGADKGKATLGTDFEVVQGGKVTFNPATGTGTITFDAGVKEINLPITIKGDNVFENQETFNVVLKDGTGYSLDTDAGKTTSVTDAITDNNTPDDNGRRDDDRPTVDLSTKDTAIPESKGSATYTFTLRDGKTSTEDVVVKYKVKVPATVGLNVAEDADFHASDKWIEVEKEATIKAGQTSVDVTVPIVNDRVYEGKETYMVEMTSVTGAEKGINEVTTVIDDFEGETTDSQKDRPRLELNPPAHVSEEGLNNGRPDSASLNNQTPIRNGQPVTADTPDNHEFDITDGTTTTGIIKVDRVDVTDTVLINSLSVTLDETTATNLTSNGKPLTWAKTESGTGANAKVVYTATDGTNDVLKIEINKVGVKGTGADENKLLFNYTTTLLKPIDHPVVTPITGGNSEDNLQVKFNIGVNDSSNTIVAPIQTAIVVVEDDMPDQDNVVHNIQIGRDKVVLNSLEAGFTRTTFTTISPDENRPADYTYREAEIVWSGTQNAINWVTKTGSPTGAGFIVVKDDTNNPLLSDNRVTATNGTGRKNTAEQDDDNYGDAIFWGGTSPRTADFQAGYVLRDNTELKGTTGKTLVTLTDTFNLGQFTHENFGTFSSFTVTDSNATNSRTLQRGALKTTVLTTQFKVDINGQEVESPEIDIEMFHAETSNGNAPTGYVARVIDDFIFFKQPTKVITIGDTAYKLVVERVAYKDSTDTNNEATGSDNRKSFDDLQLQAFDHLTQALTIDGRINNDYINALSQTFSKDGKNIIDELKAMKRADTSKSILDPTVSDSERADFKAKIDAIKEFFDFELIGSEENMRNNFEINAHLEPIANPLDLTTSVDIQGKIHIGGDSKTAEVEWLGTGTGIVGIDPSNVVHDAAKGETTITTIYGTFVGRKDGSYFFKASSDIAERVPANSDGAFSFKYQYKDNDGDVTVSDITFNFEGLNDVDMRTARPQTGQGDDNDYFVGSTQAEKLDGGAGDDTIIGNGGGDTIIGGLGNDVLFYSKTAKINGDTETGVSHVDTDILSLVNWQEIAGADGVGAIDGTAYGFKAIDFNNVQNVTNIEVVDMTNEVSQTLDITMSSVLNMTDDRNTLFIKGDATGEAGNRDKVNIAQGTEQGAFTKQTTTEVKDGITYELWTSGDAKLYIQQGLEII